LRFSLEPVPLLVGLRDGNRNAGSGEFHPLAALLVGPVVIALPYSLSRALGGELPWAGSAGGGSRPPGLNCKILVKPWDYLYSFMALWYTRGSSPLAYDLITAIDFCVKAPH
jgi:hypothetical protein